MFLQPGMAKSAPQTIDIQQYFPANALNSKPPRKYIRDGLIINPTWLLHIRFALPGLF